MSFVLMVSNGQSYSDFRAWPVATVATKEEAEKSVVSFNEWKKKVLEECGDSDYEGHLNEEKFGYDEATFFEIAPEPPFGKGKFEVNLYGRFNEYDCAYYEVDDLIVL